MYIYVYILSSSVVDSMILFLFFLASNEATRTRLTNHQDRVPAGPAGQRSAGILHFKHLIAHKKPIYDRLSQLGRLR
jgi:hypothetical protein